MLEYFVDTFSVCSGQKENGNTYDVVKHSAFSDDPLEELFWLKRMMHSPAVVVKTIAMRPRSGDSIPDQHPESRW